MSLVGCSSADYSKNMRAATAQATATVATKALLDEVPAAQYDAAKAKTVEVMGEVSKFLDTGKIGDLPFDAAKDAIVKLMKETAAFISPLGKPALITEFGGSWNAQQGYKHVDLTLHAGLWTSTCIPVGGTPMFWWWMIIEEAQLYPRYAAVSRFMKDSDLRDPAARLFTTPYTPPNIAAIGSPDWTANIVKRDGVTSNADWRIECFGTPTRAQGWIYNMTGFETLDPATSPPDNTLTLRLTGMHNAAYEIEFWDTLQGKPIQTARETARGKVLIVPMPPIVRDVAFKLRELSP
jgi:hypothetical protein